jgi:hypothetical protein
MEQPPEARNVQPAPVRQSSKRTWSIVFLVVATFFIFNGLSTDHLISAGRRVCAGVFFALVSIVIAIFDLGDRQRQF